MDNDPKGGGKDPPKPLPRSGIQIVTEQQQEEQPQQHKSHDHQTTTSYYETKTFHEQTTPRPSTSTTTEHFVETRDIRSSTPQRLRDKVAIMEKVWSTGSKRPSSSGSSSTNKDEIDYQQMETDIMSGGGVAGSLGDDNVFRIDVHALEKRLKEDKERRHTEDSPKIEFVKLRSTPQPSPRRANESDQLATGSFSFPNVTLKHRVNSSDSVGNLSAGASDGGNSNNETCSETIERTIDGGTRVIKFEKMIVKKSVREVITTGQDGSIIKTVVMSDSSRTPSEEHLIRSIGADDSAYLTHSIGGGAGGGHGSTGPSQASSYASLHDRFSSEERIDNLRSHLSATPPPRSAITTTQISSNRSTITPPRDNQKSGVIRWSESNPLTTTTETTTMDESADDGTTTKTTTTTKRTIVTGTTTTTGNVITPGNRYQQSNWKIEEVPSVQQQRHLQNTSGSSSRSLNTSRSGHHYYSTEQPSVGFDKSTTVVGGVGGGGESSEDLSSSSSLNSVQQSEWYNDYKQQSFGHNNMTTRQFARSNSQYDNHIREVRGEFY